MPVNHYFAEALVWYNPNTDKSEYNSSVEVKSHQYYL